MPFRAGKEFFAVFILCAFMANAFLRSEAAQTTNSITVGNATSLISGAVLNGGNPIILTPNGTTTVHLNFVVTDNNGCGDVFFNGAVTTTIFRSGDLMCASTAYQVNPLRCYVMESIQHSCPSVTSTNLSANVTTTFSLYYFAEATDASSSYPSDQWGFYALIRDGSTEVGGGISSMIELNTLLAIDLVTSTINYGSIAPGFDSGSSTVEIPVRNVGNASATMQISGTAFTSGPNSVPTSSQHYATSTFTYGGAEQALSAAAAAVQGFFLNHLPGTIWSDTQSLSTTWSEHAGVVKDGYFYTLGGIVGGVSFTPTVNFAQINADGTLGSWNSAANLPISLRQHGAAAWGDYIYSVGGTVSAGVTTTVHYASTTATGSIATWTRTTALPTPRDRAAVFAHNGYVYVLAGSSNTGPNSTGTSLFAPINATGSLGAWSFTTPLPNSASYANTAAAAYDDFVYLVGGYNVTGNAGSSTVWYAPINATGSIGNWTRAPSLPYGIQQHEVIAESDGLYVIAGNTPSVTTSTVLFAPIHPDGSLGNWTPVNPYPRRVYNFVVGKHNGRMYAAGGHDTVSAVTTSSVSYASGASRNTYWGMAVPGGQAGGNYTSTVNFTAVFSP